MNEKKDKAEAQANKKLGIQIDEKPTVELASMHGVGKKRTQPHKESLKQPDSCTTNIQDTTDNVVSNQADRKKRKLA